MCCGSRRSALRTSSPARSAAPRVRDAEAAALATPAIASVVLRYAGPSPVRVKGPVSGRAYDFSAARTAQAVDARDAPGLTRTGIFSRA